MKRIFTVGAGLLTLAILFVFACQKLGKEEAIELPSAELPSTITTTWEREIVDVDTFNMFVDHICQIEEISLNDAFLTPFKNDSAWTHHGLTPKIDVSRKVKRYWLDFTGVKIVEVPIVNNSKLESIYIYTFKGQFLFVRGTLETLPGGIKRLLYESLDGEPYYGFDLNNEDKLGNIFIGDRELPIEETFTNVTEEDRTIFPTCQQERPHSYVWCMMCKVTVCNENWLCSSGCGLLPSAASICGSVWTAQCLMIKGVNRMVE